jgi:hypothetical protein
MHKLPSWNRVTTLRNLTALDPRPPVPDSFSLDVLQFLNRPLLPGSWDRHS